MFTWLTQKNRQKELLNIIGQYDGLVVRSGVTVDEDLIAAAKQMRIIGRAGTGTPQLLQRVHVRPIDSLVRSIAVECCW